MKLALRVCLALLLSASSLRADEPRVAPHSIATSLLAAYARVLLHSEIGLVEVDPKGRPRQVSLVAYAAAPPQAVHDLLAHPEGYPAFVKNLKKSDVEHRPDGRIINHWRVSYPIASFTGTDEYRVEPGATGAIEIADLTPGKHGLTRWELAPLPGGGTLVQVYASTDPIDGIPFIGLLIGKDPAYEVGFYFAAMLTQVRAVVGEAGRRALAAGVKVTPPPEVKAPEFSSLLARGTVVVVRSDDAGKLVDVSVVEPMAGALPRVVDLVRSPEAWPKFVRSIKRATVLSRDAKGLEYEMEVSAVIDVTARYRLEFTPSGADTLALSGELRDARYRFDLRAAPAKKPGPSTETIAVWRGNMHVGDHNALLRSLLAMEQSFEHAANVTIGLLMSQSMARGARALPR